MPFILAPQGAPPSSPLNDSMIEVRHLRSLAAIAESRKIATAAERVHLTQSALSHQMRAIEAHYGVTLFDRSRDRGAIYAGRRSPARAREGRYGAHRRRRARSDASEGRYARRAAYRARVPHLLRLADAGDGRVQAALAGSRSRSRRRLSPQPDRAAVERQGRSRHRIATAQGQGVSRRTAFPV